MNEPTNPPNEPEVANTVPPPHQQESPAGTFGPSEFASPPPPPPPPPRYPSPPPPAAERHRFGWAEFFGGTLFGCGCLPLVALFALALIFGSDGFKSGSPGMAKKTVALVDVSGVITSGHGPTGPFSEGGAGALDVVDDLEMARKNKRVKAVVIWVNSPGGSAAGSDVIYREIQRVRADGKPVVVAMGDVAASGGYYIAAAADRVFANGATITGSIGVITEISDLTGLFRKVGYDSVVVKSGQFKDMGNPARRMTAAEKALFQNMVNDIYSQFLSAVSKGRNIPVSRLRPLADGRVFTGREALKLGLVDEIGTLQDAIRYAGEQAKIGPDPPIFEINKNPFSDLFGSTEVGYGQGLKRKLLGLLLLDPRAQEISRSLDTGSVPVPIPGER